MNRRDAGGKKKELTLERWLKKYNRETSTRPGTLNRASHAAFFNSPYGRRGGARGRGNLAAEDRLKKEKKTTAGVPLISVDGRGASGCLFNEKEKTESVKHQQFQRKKERADASRTRSIWLRGVTPFGREQGIKVGKENEGPMEGGLRILPKEQDPMHRAVKIRKEKGDE